MPVSLPTWARRSIHHDPLAIQVDASAVRLRVGIGRHLESYLQVTAGCVFTSQLGRPGFAGSLVAWPFEKKGGNVPHNRLSNSPCPRAPDSAQKARGIAQAVTFHGGARPLSRSRGCHGGLPVGCCNSAFQCSQTLAVVVHKTAAYKRPSESSCHYRFFGDISSPPHWRPNITCPNFKT